jgi:signal transduction histidine kinase
LKKNLAARWGLLWSFIFIILSLTAHYIHDYIYFPKFKFAHWFLNFFPIIFFPLVGATGTLELKENFEKTKQLRWSNIKYKILVENLPDIVYSSSPNNKFDIKFISPGVEDLCGYTVEEFYSSPDTFKKIIHPDDLGFVLSRINKIDKSVQLNYRIIHKNFDKYHYVIDHSIPVIEDNKIIAIDGIIVDITNEIKAKKRLKALTRELINTQEIERKRIATELHDEVGQALLRIKLNLNLMEKRFGTDFFEIKNTIKQTDEIVNNLVVDLKRISLDLRPSILDDLGLESTLRWYIKEFKTRTDIDVNYCIENINKRLPIDIELALYRIVQEALANVIKHSSANKVMIDIKEKNEKIGISIEDNGQGFDVEKAFNPETRGISFGIIGMQERIKELGGDFEIISTKGKGTRISLNVPIN